MKAQSNQTIIIIAAVIAIIVLIYIAYKALSPLLS